MQPFDLFKERLVQYRMLPEIPAEGYQADARARPRLASAIARIRLVVASCAFVAMTVVFVGALTAH
jgi:hypothetical protein